MSVAAGRVPGMPPQTDPGNSRPSPGSSAEGRPSAGGQISPHDSVFRRIFGVPENTASQLRAVLPPDLADRLDLGQLSQVSATFIDESLKRRHSDLLFSAPLDGRDAFVYVLVEHQSRSDPLMAFRMLRYVTRIWDAYLDEHPQARTLPLVIPLVVHNGSGRWTAPTRLQDLIDPVLGQGREAGEHMPRFSFLLDDLAVIDPGQLRARKLTPSALVTLLLLKTAPGNSRLPEDLQDWKTELRAVLDQPGGDETFLALLTYIELVSETPDSELGRLAASLGPDAEKVYMTTAEMIRTQDRSEMLIKVLDARFGPLPESLPRKVRKASSNQLEKWAIRAATVATLDDVFA